MEGSGGAGDVNTNGVVQRLSESVEALDGRGRDSTDAVEQSEGGCESVSLERKEESSESSAEDGYS